MLCEKRCYVSADGKPGFDWEDREVFWSNIYVRRSALRESNCKCSKSGIHCGPVYSSLDCGNVVLEAQGFNELRDNELSSSSDEDEDESNEGQ